MNKHRLPTAATLLCSLIALLILFVLAQPASLALARTPEIIARAPAASYTVDTLADELDSGCVAGDCSLREAISAANANAGADSITFDASLGIAAITLSVIGSQSEEDGNAYGDLDISDDLTIDGEGRITVDGNGIDRVFHIINGAEATLIGLKITGGYDNYGGGVLNDLSTLTLRNVWITANEATSIVGWGGGGGIDNHRSTLTIENSTIANNTAQRDAGGIFNSGSITILNSTISGNRGGQGVAAYGCGLLSTGTDQEGAGPGASVIMINTTVVENENGSPYTGGICSDGTGAGSAVTLINSLIANNTDSIPSANDNCVTASGGTITAGLDTLVAPGYAHCAAATIDTTASDYLPLGNNGGSTPTHALKETNAAVDWLNIDTDQCPHIDQREYSRDANCDVGAYEFGATSGLHYAIGNLVWADLDGNGVHDAGEAGLSGVTIELCASLDCSDPSDPLATDTSDENGLYGFANLSAGAYYLRFSHAGYAFSPQGVGAPASDSNPDPVTGMTAAVVVPPDNTTVDAGMWPVDYQFNGTTDADSFLVAVNGANVEVWLDGVLRASLRASDLESLTVDGQGGDDSFELQDSAAGVSYTIAGSTGNDIFDINGDITMNLDGGINDDTFNFEASRSFTGTIDGGIGTDWLYLDNTSVNSDASYDLRAESVEGGPLALDYGNIETVEVDFGSRDDTVHVWPSATTAHVVDGGQHATADALHVDAGGVGVNYLQTPGLIAFSGGVRQPITWKNFESLHIFNAPADLAVRYETISAPVAGSVFTYRIYAENNGPSDVTGAIVTGSLPDQATYLSDSRGCGASSLTGAGCALGNITSGASAFIDVTVSIDAEATGTLISEASVFAGANISDANLGNNSETYEIDLLHQAELALTKLIQPEGGAVSVGETITYTLSVDNFGSSYAHNLALTNTLSALANVTINSVTADRGVCTPGIATICTLEQLEPNDAAGGGRWTITIIVTASAAQSLNSVATVRSDASDPELSNNTAEATVEIIAYQIALPLVLR